jgi:pilus assembly protein CpaE
MPRTTSIAATAALKVLAVGTTDETGIIAAALDHCAIALRLTRAEIGTATESVRADMPHVVLVPIDTDSTHALAVLQRLAWHAPGATLVALSARRGPETVLRAMRAGAGEVLTYPLDVSALCTTMEKVVALRHVTQPAAASGTVWTTVAPKEGVGATTLVANLGLQLQTAHDRRVVLIDLDLRNGDLALLLNVEPLQSLADLAVGADRLDAMFLHGALARHPSGLSLLASATARGRDAGGLTAAHVGHVLDLLRATHHAILIDAPPPLSDAALAAATLADHVLVPTEATVPCLRATWRMLENLAGHGVPPGCIDVVVTRYAGGEAHLTLDEIAEALGHPVRHVVPREDDTAALAVNSGLPIAEVRQDGPLQLAIADLASLMMHVDTTRGAPAPAVAHLET